jgi:tetratricopeptide (TPR) repeat protein
MLMRKSLLLFITGLFIVAGSAQVQNVDSLKQVLNTQPDTAKLGTLKNLAGYYQDNKIDSGLFYAKELLSLSTARRNVRAMSMAYAYFGQYEYVIGNYPQSLQLLFKSMELAESIGDTNRIANTHNLLGNAYKEYGDWHKAKDHFLETKRLAELSNDKGQALYAYMNLGQAYTWLNQLDSALITEQTAYSMALPYHSIWLGVICNRLANIHAALNNKELALQYYRIAEQEIKKTFGDSRGLSTCYIEFARFCLNQKKTDSAIVYSKLSMQVAKKIPYLRGIGIAARFLSGVYELQNRNDSAFFYQKIYVAVTDSINSREKTSGVENLSFIQQLKEQEKEQEAYKLQEERKHNLQLVFIAIAILSIIILFLLLSRSIIVHHKVVEYLGVIVLLVVFEFINLLLHPFLERVTQHSTIFMLLALVAIAALIVPLHHRLQKWVSVKLVEKNKQIRLNAAKKTIEKLEKEG